MAEGQESNSLPYRPYLQPKRDFFPKASITILKKWLYANRYSPYATIDDKLHLAKLTNLTQRQISVWLTNARRFQLPKWIREDGRDPDDFTLAGQRRRIARRYNWTLALPGPRKRRTSTTETTVETEAKIETTQSHFSEEESNASGSKIKATQTDFPEEECITRPKIRAIHKFFADEDCSTSGPGEKAIQTHFAEEECPSRPKIKVTLIKPKIKAIHSADEERSTPRQIIKVIPKEECTAPKIKVIPIAEEECPSRPKIKAIQKFFAEEKSSTSGPKRKIHAFFADDEPSTSGAGRAEPTFKEDVPEKKKEKEKEEPMENHQFADLYLLSEVAVAVQRYEAYQRRGETQ